MHLPKGISGVRMREEAKGKGDYKEAHPSRHTGEGIQQEKQKRETADIREKRAKLLRSDRIEWKCGNGSKTCSERY